MDNYHNDFLERYKEEIWNLELKNQDLNQRLEELNQCYVKSKSEITQHTRLAATLSHEVELLKAMKHTWEQKLQQAQIEYEEEIVNLKKSLHTSKSEKETLSKQLQDLIAEQAAAAATVNLRHISNEEVRKHEKFPSKPFPTSASMSVLPTETATNKNTMKYAAEVITLQKSLDQAHEIIQSMQGQIDKERGERLEVDTLLREAQETIESFRSISQNNSTQWYPPTQSPTSSTVHNIDREHLTNSENLLFPTHPNSTYSNYTKNSDLHNGKSGRKVYTTAPKSPVTTCSGGKSLCDELTLAASIGNFASSTAAFNDESLKAGVTLKEEVKEKEDVQVQSEMTCFNLEDLQKENSSSPRVIMNDQQGINRICSGEEKDVVHSVKAGVITEQAHSLNEPIQNTPVSKENEQIKPIEQILSNIDLVKITELSQIDLPSISNHEMYSSFSSKTSSSKSNTDRSNTEEGEDNYSEEIEVTIPKRNVNYGSLLKKPESYIYKSRRELDEEIKRQKKAVTKAMLANVTIEKTPKSKLGSGSRDLDSKKGDDVDDKSVSALTRTMIGDWMWKYTRKVVGGGISENKHRRFFWIHPYTQTLYWSSKEPGSNNRQSNTKSVLVESFAILENDSESEKSIPPSILIQTPSRGLKIQCMNIIAHQAWIKSLNFLLDGEQTEDEVQPKLTSLDTVSKQHYLQRKKSTQKLQPSIDTSSSTIATKTKDDNSDFVNISRVPFKFEPIATMTIDDLMPLPSPTVFNL